MTRNPNDLLAELAALRRYREGRQADLPLSIQLPFVRNRIRRRAHSEWAGGYVLAESGDYFYVPREVDLMSARRLLKHVPADPMIAALCRPGDVAMDVGANIGDWMVPLARAVGEAGRVLAFEPIPHMAGALRKTARVNRLRQAQVFELALAESDGRAAFSVEAGNTGGSRLGQAAGDRAVIEVETARLDSFAAAHSLRRLDFVKIDVEGFEHAVLAGARETLAAFRPALVFETGQEDAPRREAVAALLSSLGYEPVGLSVVGGIVEAGWDDYRAGSGPFAEAGITNLLVMAS